MRKSAKRKKRKKIRKVKYSSRVLRKSAKRKKKRAKHKKRSKRKKRKRIKKPSRPKRYMYGGASDTEILTKMGFTDPEAKGMVERQPVDYKKLITKLKYAIKTKKEKFDMYLGTIPDVEEMTPQYVSEIGIVYLQNDTNLSFWNGIPLQPNSYDGQYHFICEIPKDTSAKMEINTSEHPHHIIQDKDVDGEPRFYKFTTMPFNYGCFPQTWEDPKITTNGYQGDNDPLDVIDIGEERAETGLVYKVHVLGILGMIDSGEMDWKVVVINVKDKNSEHLSTHKDPLNDEKVKDKLEEFVMWMKYYKQHKGVTNDFLKPPVECDKDADKYPMCLYFNKAKAIEVIKECHKQWDDGKNPLKK